LIHHNDDESLERLRVKMNTGFIILQTKQQLSLQQEFKG